MPPLAYRRSLAAVPPLVGPFDPTRIAGLRLFLRSDLGIIQSGGLISAWNDQSGNGNHATQGTAALQPTSVANVQNGLPAVRFDGSRFLSLAQEPFAQEFSVFAVFSTTHPTYQQAFIATDHTVTNALAIAGVSNNMGMCGSLLLSDGPNDITTVDTTVIVAATPYLFSATSLSGWPARIFLNTNRNKPTVAPTGHLGPLPATYATNNWQIGAWYTGSFNDHLLYGDLFALITYNRAVTERERRYLCNGLNTLFGIY